MLSLSTAWNYRPEADARTLLTEIRATGITAIELGYRLTVDQVEAMPPILKDLGMKASSVHNFSPIPNDAPSPRHASNHYRLSSQDEEERRRAVLWTKRSVDTAVRFGAGYVVIHAGMIEMPDDPSQELLNMYRDGKGGTRDFADLRSRLVSLRAQHRGPYVDNVVKSLREVIPYALERGVIIGLETRYYPNEIPDYREVGELLAAFPKGMMYWHDVGHGEVNGRLGIAPHMDYLNTYKDRLAGFHLHGVKVIRDHQAPFEGDFDFTSVMPHIQDSHIKVIESHHYASPDQIREAVRRLS